jgi:hypothetical protein
MAPRRNKPSSVDEQDPPDDEDAADDGDLGPDDEEPTEDRRPEADKPAPRRVAPSPLDERVGSPGTGGARFMPGGFPMPGGMGPGGNQVPPLRAPAFFGPGAGGMTQPPPIRRMDPRRDEGEGGYANDADAIEAEQLPPSDEGRARAMLFDQPDDMRVSVRVLQCGPGYNLPRGEIEDVMLSWARAPERYIPYGGKWHLEFFSQGTGHLLRNGRKTVTLPGPNLPLDAEWRVDLMIDEQRKLKMMWDLANGGGGIQFSGSNGSHQIPRNLYDSETAFWRDKAEKMDQRMQDLERRLLEQAAASERRALEDRIRQLESGGGAGARNPVLETITALAPFMQNNRGGVLEEKMLDAAMRMNGPEMMMAQGEFFNKMMEAQAKYLKGGSDSGDGGLLDMVKPAIKDFGLKYIEGMQKRQEARDQFMMERQRAKEEREAKAAEAARHAHAPAAVAPAQAPQAPQAAAAPSNGKSTNRITFERMFDDVKHCLFAMKDPGVPAEKRPTADDAGRKLGLCMLTTLENKLYEGEDAVLGILSDALVNPKTEAVGNPEMFVSRLCLKFQIEPDVGLAISRRFRSVVGIPPLEVPTAPPASAAQPVVQASTVAPEPVPAPPPEPVEQPVVSSTIRLSDPSLSEQPKEPAPGASADNKALTPVAPPAPPAPADAPGPDSPKVEGQNAVAGEIGEPEGPVHVVESRPEAPVAQGVEVRRPKGKRGKPPEQDGVRVKQPAGPPAEVEQPAVP